MLRCRSCRKLNGERVPLPQQVTGVDGESPALEQVKAGAYAATAGYPLTYREHTIAAAKLCADEKVPNRIKLDSTLITKDNVAKYESNPPQ